MIVVTGASGFIGSAYVYHLNQQGRHDILVVDNQDQKNSPNLQFLKYQSFTEHLYFLKAIENNRPFDSPIEAIIHMGACSDTTEQDMDFLRANNTAYTQALITYAIAHHIRIIYASSAATYGDGRHGYRDDLASLSQLKPLNPYGQSKHWVDLWCAQHQTFDQVVGLKFFNVYGPHEYHKGDMRSVAHKAYGQIQDHGRVRLFKSHHPEYQDGEQMRDFIYIKDVLSVIDFFRQHSQINGLFNVASGQARSFKDLVLALFAALQQEPDIEYFDMPEHIRHQYQYFTQGDLQKLRSAGYDKDFMSLEEGIKDYVRYLSSAQPYFDSGSAGGS